MAYVLVGNGTLKTQSFKLQKFQSLSELPLTTFETICPNFLFALSMPV